MNIVYKTTNKINGKIYIGVHTRDDINYLGSGIKLRRAIAKYGKENFLRETLAEFDTPEEAFEIEERYICLYNSRNDTVGYNISHGGKGGNTGNYSGHSTRFAGKNNPSYGKTPSDQTKQKQRESLGKWLETSEGLTQRESKRAYFSSEDNPGKNKTQLTKDKISAATKGKKVKPRQTYVVFDPSGVEYICEGEMNLQGLCRYAGISFQILKKKCRTGIEYNGGTKGWTLIIKQNNTI